MFQWPRLSTCVKVVAALAAIGVLLLALNQASQTRILSFLGKKESGIQQDIYRNEAATKLPENVDIMDGMHAWTEDVTPIGQTAYGGDQEQTHDDLIRARFEQRSQLLLEQCDRPETRAMMSQPNSKAKDTIVKFAGDRLTCCYVPKVGTTFTKGVRKQHISKLKEKDYLEANVTKSYFMVREPYSRIMSAYVDKIVSNQQWWPGTGSHIVSNYRENATQLEKKCGSDATFPEYIKYLISSQKNMKNIDRHFRPIYQQCEFCDGHYDFIGHLETIEKDMDYILRAAGVPQLKDLNFDNSEDTLASKCKNTVQLREEIERCEDMCDMMQSVWWTFHVRGLISKDIPLPVSGKRCHTISEDEFAELALKAHRDSADIIDRSKQKKEALADLFSQVTLEDRLSLRQFYLPDFELFGYGSTPPDIFPEFKGTEVKG